MTFHFQFYDKQTADTYLVEVASGQFSAAYRYVLNISREPIVYKDLANVPEPQQSEIKKEIQCRTRKV